MLFRHNIAFLEQENTKCCVAHKSSVVILLQHVVDIVTIFMKFVSDHSLYEKSAVHVCVGLLCVSTSSDQVQNLHAALTSCYLHLLFSLSFSNITSSMGNQPCMQVLGFCA